MRCLKVGSGECGECRRRVLLCNGLVSVGLGV
jgi:hypothetical protein